ncbi:hypothetical protein [Dietzia sp. ANT_WB102]|uniref:DUF6928 family protein n=1 Tax=Dietzia sp. ANT_WB102 TaxID=2597345 RepID=UPI0011EDA3F4|nr:hypothetical protein [Dietzia sp. ANT_WB102]KAA0916925.1 hypothetical protein FQ137_11780 [Dietzia sp. ANT_WB102]
MGHHVATFWYLATTDPAAPIRAGHPSDPGFARRLLSRLFPTVTVASLGAFPLNRSASVGPGEIYVGSFPGLTVVQTTVEGPVTPSATSDTWLRLVEAPTVLLFAQDPEDAVSGFARWESGRLVRAFAGADDRIVEDEGMPLPFERPYWAGEFPLDEATDNPLALPFSPSSLLHAAHRDWLGFDLEPGGLDVPVHGFATDGRREIRQHTPLAGPALHVVGMPGRAELHAAARRAAGSGPDTDASGRFANASSPYADDDYERLPSRRGARRAGGSGGRFRGIAGLVGDAVRRGADSLSRRRRGGGSR